MKEIKGSKLSLETNCSNNTRHGNKGTGLKEEWVMEIAIIKLAKNNLKGRLSVGWLPTFF
jgi:hypothetical protein